MKKMLALRKKMVTTRRRTRSGLQTHRSTHPPFGGDHEDPMISVIGEARERGFCDAVAKHGHSRFDPARPLQISVVRHA